MSYHGPEWGSEMVCAECGLSYVSTRYVEVEPVGRSSCAGVSH